MFRLKSRGIGATELILRYLAWKALSSNVLNNTLIIDVSRKRNGQQKLFCVLCNNEKIQLECFNIPENRYRCPRCRSTYQVGFEILPSEDVLESSHEEDSVGLLVAEDEISEEDSDPGSIPIPKYMQDSETTRVTNYQS
jgi:hypothetical protein